jgi:hypothetical protein
MENGYLRKDMDIDLRLILSRVYFALLTTDQTYYIANSFREECKGKMGFRENYLKTLVGEVFELILIIVGTWQVC